ncbi:magnesium transporter [Parvimonas sp. oral taxon 393 str. F0440]|nr:magnesium transporter [Parvimonas sp. oral taxon 393 str. F0440]
MDLRENSLEKSKIIANELKTSLEEKNIFHLRDIIYDTNEVTLANIFEEYFEIKDILFMFKVIKKEKTAEIFAYLPQNMKQQVINGLQDHEIKVMLDYMFTDDISEFLEELPANIVKRVLNSASNQRRSEINMILNFKENSAGSVMSTDYVELDPEITADEALKMIKDKERLAETISYCYITNNQHILLGFVSMKSILLASANTLISDIMETDVISVECDEDQEEVAKIFTKYDLLVLPVVNDQHRLIGIITIDDVYDIIQDEVTEDLQKMGGITPIEGSYINMSIIEMVKSRITWLLILMISATVSGLILSKNSDLTLKIPSLVIFIPMLMDTAGNAGSQSSAMVVRGIAVDNLNIGDFKYVIKTEFLNSLILGAILFAVNILRILVFMPKISMSIAILISATIYIIVTIANLIGGILPLLASTLKQDPASMSGPILTTVCDAISLTIYFSLASLFLGGGLYGI